jgi:hypothetical protein
MEPGATPAETTEIVETSEKEIEGSEIPETTKTSDSDSEVAQM